jgi:hypothetical protein
MQILNARATVIAPMVKVSARPAPAMIRTIFIVSAIASVAVAAVTVHRVAEYREWSRLDAISRAV